jgi:hypothetical protein
MLGMPILTQGMDLELSYEHQWRTLYQEIVQYMWAKAAIGGPPRTTSMMRFEEKGRYLRRRHYQEIATPLVLDPNFGAANVAMSLSMAAQTFVFTVLVEATTTIAQRAWQAPRRQQQMLNPAYRVDFRDLHDRLTEYLFLFNKSPGNAVVTISHALERIDGDFDRLFFPDTKQYFLADMLNSNERAFENKILDVTQPSYFAAADMEALSFPEKRYGTVRVGPREVVAIAVPTFKDLRLRAQEEGVQVLLRQIALASIYMFRRLDYSQPTDKYSDNDLTMEIPVLDAKSGRWQKVSMDEALRQSLAGYWFAGEDSVQPDDAPKAALTTLSGKNATKLYDDMGRVRDADEMGNKAQEAWAAATEISEETTLHRLLPTFAHFDATGPNPTIVEVKQLGEIVEPYLRSAHLLRIAKGIIVQNASADNTKLFGYLARLPSAQTGTEIAKEYAAIHGATINGGTDAEKAQELAYIYHAMLAKGPAAVNDAAAGTVRLNPPADIVRPGPKGLKSISLQGLGALPDTALTALEPYDAVFAHWESTQDKDFAARLATSWKNRFDRFGNDVGKSGLYAQIIAAELQKGGVDHAKTKETWPSLASNEALFNNLKGLIAPSSDLQQASRVIEDRLGAPEWSMSRALASGAPLGARIVPAGGDDHIDFPYRGLPIPQLAKLALPMDVTRLRSFVDNEAPGLDTLELFVFLKLCQIPVTPLALAQLARMGIQVVQVGLVRFGQCLTVYNMLAVLKAAHAYTMAPLLVQMSIDPSLENMRLYYDVQAGLRVKNSFGASEIASILNDRVQFGFNGRIQRSIDETRDAFDERHRHLVDDITVVVMPITEQAHEFPLLSPLYRWPAQGSGKTPPPHHHQLSVGFSQLRTVLGADTLRATHNALTRLTTGDDLKGFIFSPLVERGTCRYYNQSTRQWSDVSPGTGAIGSHLMTDPGSLADACNGKPVLFPQLTRPHFVSS